MGKTAPTVSASTGNPSPAFEIVSLAAFGISCLVVAYRYRFEEIEIVHVLQTAKTNQNLRSYPCETQTLR